MWPFSDMSLEAAFFWGSVGSFGFLASLIVGVACAFLMVTTSSVKQNHFEAARTDLVRHAARLDADAMKARENTARLVNESIALRRDVAAANARAVEAQVALEKFKAPRSLTLEQQSAIVDGLRQFAGLPFVIAAAADAESVALMTQIEEALTEAGLVQQPWKGRDLLPPRPGNRPPTGLTPVVGLYVQADVSRQAQFEMVVTAIAAALKDEGGLDARPEIGRMTANTNQAAIQILVGKKP